MAPTSPGLWSDRPAGSEHDWLAPGERAAPSGSPAPDPPSPPPPRRSPLHHVGRAQKGVLAVLLVAAGLGGAGLAGAELGDDGRAATGATAQTLPAAAGRPAATDVNGIVAAASDSVVSIRVGGGSGTGFVLDANGTIVTNAHVVGSSSTAQVRFDDGRRTVDGRVVGTDPSTDLAVIRVDPSDTGPLKALTLADSGRVRVGDAAVAIGYPLGLDQTATSGIVSGLGRQIEAPNGFSIDEVIQTDAPINPGNSGGPLLDGRGRVIGVNSQIATAGGGNGNVGIGFAVPSNTVREIVPRLQAGQSIDRPYLGVSTAATPDGRGAQVGAVTAGGPAADAGLRTGDVLVAVDGERIAEPDDVSAAIADREPGDAVEVEIRRGGSEQTLSVELGTRPGATP